MHCTEYKYAACCYQYSVVCMSVCVCVCLSVCCTQQWALKWLNWLRCCLGYGLVYRPKEGTMYYVGAWIPEGKGQFWGAPFSATFYVSKFFDHLLLFLLRCIYYNFSWNVVENLRGCGLLYGIWQAFLCALIRCRGIWKVNNCQTNADSSRPWLWLGVCYCYCLTVDCAYFTVIVYMWFAYHNTYIVLCHTVM